MYLSKPHLVTKYVSEVSQKMHSDLPTDDNNSDDRQPMAAWAHSGMRQKLCCTWPACTNINYIRWILLNLEMFNEHLSQIQTYYILYFQRILIYNVLINVLM